MQESALRAAENYEKQALDRLRRMGIAAAELELKSGKKMGALANQGDLMVEETLG
jgi:COP9 signalosome complex subunit 1